ncbi:hypothetical protein DSL72_004114 [Monilinia vaccinii-corymbosi]|uniref:Uncharacterized protein n=1 Tax=Monilinia vaccinii-corymbosi TaxID=61207 RepID=A0A8A3P6Y4_9HELO|nr:hypothetical protein DSL72_004114 [Monilinia vaccinii-corymbosi]
MSSEEIPMAKTTPTMTPHGNLPGHYESIITVRDLAWDVFPWACVGEFWFIMFGLSRHPQYQQLIRLLTSKAARGPSEASPKFLDIGTCIGQDLRALHRDGAPLSSLYGIDAIPEFETIGYALFRDEDHFLPGHDIVGDIIYSILRRIWPRLPALGLL